MLFSRISKMKGLYFAAFIASVFLCRKSATQNLTSSTVFTTVSTPVTSSLNATRPVNVTVGSNGTAFSPTTSTNGTTTTVVPTTATLSSTTVMTNYSCRNSLSKSQNLSPFWVTIVLSAVPITTDIANCSWKDLMETRLLNFLTAARSSSISSSGRRRKRAASNGQLVLQLVSAVRGSSSPAGNSTKVSLVFYALLSGSYLPANSVVASLSLVSSSAASELGYLVESTATTYEILPSAISYVWLIGAMFGSLAGIVIIIWGVLIVYQKCIRPYDPSGQKRWPLETTVDDFYADGALANIPDMRANPKLSFSKADIGTIANEVARHLDEHMSELVHSTTPAGGGERLRGGMDVPDGQQPMRRHPNADISLATDEGNETPQLEIEEAPVAATRAKAVQSQLAADEHENASSDDAHSEKAKKDKNKKKKKKKDKKKKKKKKDQKKKEKKNSSDSDSDDAKSDDTDDDANRSRRSRDSSEVESSLHQTASSPPASFISMDTVIKLSSTANNPLSPYRTGDEIARIRPMLEEDLKLQEMSPIKRAPQPPPQTSQPHQQESAAGGGPRFISVRPRSQLVLNGAAEPPRGLAVLPDNQDEWDVVRELARRPDSDPRALLSSVRLEVAGFANSSVRPSASSEAQVAASASVKI